MKKILDDDYKVYISDKFNDIKKFIKVKLPYPFEKSILNLLKEENRFEQKYYYIEKGSDFAFFIIYKNRMNLFTFGKAKLYYTVNVIGYPCSLSNPGYITNNEKMLLNYIKRIKGAKLVLNVNKLIEVSEMTIGETLPTCIFKNNFKTIEEYLSSLRSSYRRRIIKSIKMCKDIYFKSVEDNSIDIYELYLNTYNKSNYKLEKLERGFFENVKVKKIIFFKDNKPIGFVLLKKYNKKLIFMLCGMNYHYDTTDLYYYMLYNIVKFGIDNKCQVIDFGQTSEETKLKFGANIEKRYFYAHHTNKIINNIVRSGKDLLEYKYEFPNYNVFREEIL